MTNLNIAQPETPSKAIVEESIHNEINELVQWITGEGASANEFVRATIMRRLDALRRSQEVLAVSEEEDDSDRISKTSLLTVVKNTLADNGIRTFRQLTKITERELLRTPFIGHVALRAIKQELAQRGMRLADG